MPEKLTIFLAVWGAITGSAALCWDFYKWKTGGPKIRMTAFGNMVVATPGVGIDRTRRISIKVTNVGTARTTLSSLGVVCYSSRWQRLRKRPARHFVVNDTGPHCKPLPCPLEVGDVWSPLVAQDELLEETGREYVEFQLWHSASEEPIVTRLLLPDDEKANAKAAGHSW